MDTSDKTLQEKDVDFHQLDLNDTEPASRSSTRRVIHFTSGEITEESSSDEEEIEDVRIEFQEADTRQLSWGSYVWLWMTRIARISLFSCDFLGGKLASVLGLDAAKYQYAINEHKRQQKENGSEEDGVELQEIKTSGTSETHHLQMESLNYGAVHLGSTQDTSPKQPLSSGDQMRDGNYQNIGFEEDNEN
ncbi:protein FAM177B [Protopterus annectens]|uniref:protein FAM177B n=1 Tax=Protopterus annectens TaxID=7888 RepID=UPI001CFB5BD3|nr:protein FAM177B [Protopterus annectens]XP_043913851.1 protein FAM177B [Protopterus annectens]